MKIKKVIIDPGHGGEDFGAMRGYELEKNFNLSFAYYIREELKKLNLSILMTREQDESVALMRRTRTANDFNADLFISLHCNSWHSDKPKGIQVYYHPDSIKGPNIADIFFANLLNVYGEKTKWCYVSSANYVVLRETKMPAILIEVGFLSNLEDFQLIKMETYKKEIAKAVGKSIYSLTTEKKLKRGSKKDN